MPFARIARAEEVPPGQTLLRVAAERPVVLANWEGRIFALRGLCPHRGNPLEGAQMWDNLITCPWHNYQYDVETGRNHYPRNVFPEDLRKDLSPLRTYRVEIREGEVWVDLD